MMTDIERCSKFQEHDHFSYARGILGSIVGMFICILVMLLCSLFQIVKLGVAFQLLVGLVIGWFYRLFHGQRSKIVAYVNVGSFTILTCILWGALPVLLPAAISSVQLTAADWSRLWSMIWKLLPPCIGLGITGFFLTRKSLLAYADWKRGPWIIAYAGGNGLLYNLIPQKLPAESPPTSFAVHGRFTPEIGIIVEGNNLRQKNRLRKDRVFSVRDIAGVVLGPSNGCNVLYDKNYQVLAKFAGSMEHADLLFLSLLKWNIPIDNAPAEWRDPSEVELNSNAVESSVHQQQFTLRLKRSSRIGFAVFGWFEVLIGLGLFLAVNFFDVTDVTIVERGALLIVVLAAMGVGIICLRIGKVCMVKVDGEQMRVVSRFGRATEFSVKDVSSVSRNLGWIVLYDKNFKILAKLDSYLENIDILKDYLEIYGIKM